MLTAVLIVLLIGAVKGYMKGFLRLAVWFAGLVAVLFIVTKLSPFVSDFLINNTSISDNIRERIILAYETEYVEKGTIDSFGFPELITDSIESNSTSRIYDRIAVSIFTDYISLNHKIIIYRDICQPLRSRRVHLQACLFCSG